MFECHVAAHYTYIVSSSIVHRCSGSSDNGKAQYYGVHSVQRNFSIIKSCDIICGHVLTYRIHVSTLNS